MSQATDTHDGSTDTAEQFLQFLKRYYREDVGEFALAYPDEQQSLTVSHRDLYQFDSGLADRFLDHPGKLLDVFERGLQMFDHGAGHTFDGANVRVVDLPDSDTFSVGERSPSDAFGDYLGVEGQVMKVTDAKPWPLEASYECLRCGSKTEIHQPVGNAQTPTECIGCERQGPFQLDYGSSTLVDYQLARVQEPPEETAGGQASELDVRIRDDLVDRITAGDRVTLQGTLELEANEDMSEHEPYLDTNGIELDETDYDEVDVTEHRDLIEEIAAGEHGDPYDLLVGSINPKHHGDEHIKLAIALQMFGGWKHDYPDGSEERGDSHILLLGDPGCGKSSILRAVNEIAPRSTYASGKGATAAGMTAAAIPDDFGNTKFSLKAGALVLADKGIACVDEIDKVKDDARASMHEALEDQQVHVNKAGFNTHLRAQTSLLAAGNPKHGRFDPHEPIADQIDLGPTLLSRFDLMFMLEDNPDEERDREIADHKVRSRQIAGRRQRGETVDDEELETIKPAIPKPVIRAYIAHAKQTCYPTIEDDDVMERLKDAFTTLRLSNGDDRDSPVPVTFRKLEAIQRLAEASARVRLSETVTTEDVERAMQLVGKSMRDVGMSEDGQFDADIVEAGQSKSQHERRKIVRAIIVELQEPGDPASVEDVKERAENEDIDRAKVEGDIEHYKRQGEAYEPEPGSVRMT